MKLFEYLRLRYLCLRRGHKYKSKYKCVDRVYKDLVSRDVVCITVCLRCGKTITRR